MQGFLLCTFLYLSKSWRYCPLWTIPPAALTFVGVWRDTTSSLWCLGCNWDQHVVSCGRWRLKKPVPILVHVVNGCGLLDCVGFWYTTCCPGLHHRGIRREVLRLIVAVVWRGWWCIVHWNVIARAAITWDCNMNKESDGCNRNLVIHTT